MKSGRVNGWLGVFMVVAALYFGIFGNAPRASAQSTEDRLRDLFTTAGYATAFGAAFGAAALSFQERPEQHLRYISIGASLGFIGGSILGTYVMFTPIVAEKSPHQQGFRNEEAFAFQPSEYRGEVVSQPTTRISPHFDAELKGITGISAQWTLPIF